MINITDKSKCSGCAACYSACPVKAIMMKPDEQGFLYPEISDKCTECGRCLSLCPLINPVKEKKRIKNSRGTGRDNSMDTVSIVVPVYNTNEELFNRCISSLVNQTYENIEIILVDDGSSSGIEIVCDKYKKLYPNIVVIHKENGGLSSARNVGQEVATGDWILFVDSDDWIDCETCEELIKVAGKYDSPNLIAFGFVHHLGRKTVNCAFKVDNTIIVGNKDNSLVAEALQFPSLLSSSCWKLYKSTFLEANQLRHNESLRQGSEDLEFMIRVLIRTQTAVIVNKRFYHYIMNPNSITNSFDKNNAYLVQACFEEIEKHIMGLNNNELIQQFYVRSWYALCASLVSGFFNVHNRLTYSQRKASAREYLSTDFSQKIMKNVDKKRLGCSRRIVYLAAANNCYCIMQLIGFIRGIQKNRR